MAIEPTGNGRFRWVGSGADVVPAIFHAVRRMSYASTAVRTPTELVRTGRGACTAKHLLLNELLTDAGIVSRVETMRGFFGRGIPTDAPGMSGELRRMIREGGVLDYHHFVTAELDGREVTLDATWHDALILAGFPVNHDWDGYGDTRLALVGERLSERPTDVLAFKAEHVASLSAAERERRTRFLALMRKFVEGVEEQSGEGESQWRRQSS